MVAFSTTRPSSLREPASTMTCASQKNVGDIERVASVISGGLMILNAIPSRPLSALLLGGCGAALIYRGITGHCECYKALGISTRNEEGRMTAVPAQYGFKYEKSLVINRGAHDLFDFWRDLENLPRIMPHLTSVKETGGGHSHWVATGPLGVEVEWDAEVYNEDPGRLIAWRSLPGGDVDTAGSVHFEEHGAGRGTEVRVVLKYNPPLGKVGANLAWLLGSGVEKEIDNDLRRFRQMMESGAFSRSRMQVAGRGR
jgi:uncharacterized membrane protein